MNFFEWLAENTSQVEIDDRKIRQNFQLEVEKYRELSKERVQRVKTFNPQYFFQDLQKQLQNYEGANSLVRALQSQDRDLIYREQSKLRNWLMELPFQDSTIARQVSKEIFTYIDFLDKDDDLELIERQLQELLQQSIKGTQQEMAKVKAFIEEAIGRINNWNGTYIRIEPEAGQDEFGSRALEAAKSAEITLGNDEYAPKFMMFRDEQKMEIDDILEGGDDDFFQTPQIQSDYFNLINELRKPGSTGRGKNLTLYTARPQTDRQQFLQQKTLPVNLFLTNNYENAEGISREYGAKRDIWKVRINSQYLTQTLDASIKHYQITVDNSPVITMELL